MAHDATGLDDGAGPEREDLDARAASTLLSIGARIRELRMQRGLTLQGISELTGLSPSLLSLVERGKTSPSIGTLVAVAYALEVHMV
ncbi:MAG: helix-turn-helix domain-containing protein, partial [Acidimicrobiia bacterium]